MAEDRSIDLLDYLAIILKWKKLLILILFFSLFLSFLTVYFFIDEQFESTALIIPSDDTSLGNISGLMKNLKGLPLGLGGSSNSTSTDLYKTIIYSRANLENLVNIFNLKKDYKLESLEKTINVLSSSIEADVTNEDAFQITVRANSGVKAKNMVNKILDLLNKKVIELNIAKSRENRIFLENRYSELKLNLKNAEDSLQRFQEKSGMFEAKEQIKVLAGAYSELETKLMTKQTELQILKNLYDSESPQLKMLKSEVTNFEKEISELKKDGRPQSFFLAFNTLPKKVKNYFRYFRDVEIYNSILEFIVPLYEQAKFEEQKNMPVLQVIDYGSIPEKKSYPPRAIFAVLASLLILAIIILYLIFKEILSRSNNPKVKYIYSEMKIFKKKSN